MLSSNFFWPGVMLALALALIAFEWNVASKRKGGVNVVDKKKMTGMFGIGLAMSALVYVVQRIL